MKITEGISPIAHESVNSQKLHIGECLLQSHPHFNSLVTDPNAPPKHNSERLSCSEYMYNAKKNTNNLSPTSILKYKSTS